MSWNELLCATALEQATLIRTRAVSSEEIVRLYLERIERINPQVNAFVSRFPRRAIAWARWKDAEVRLGADLPAFHGVPIGIKDLNFVRFATTRMGSRAVPPLFSPIDDKTTTSVRRGGFVILGKLATSEVGAMPVTEPDTHGPTRNPWNPSYSAGGSSGGSGAAVAARLLPIAHGSDGAGSIRIPAAFCHLYGMKPSRGRVPNAFGKRDGDILYTCGPIARSVADAAALLDVLAGLDVRRPHWAPAPPATYLKLLEERVPSMRIRVITRPPFGETDPEVIAAVERAATLLGEMGHKVEYGEAPEATLEEFLPLWQQLITQTPVVWPSRAQPITEWLYRAGKKLRGQDMTALRRRLAARLSRGLGDADIWLTPTVGVPPPRIGAFRGLPAAESFNRAANLGVFTALVNITGQPAASVPLGLTSAGLPIGLHVVGRLYQDEDVFAISRQLEEAIPWRSRTAPVGAERPD